MSRDGNRAKRVRRLGRALTIWAVEQAAAGITAEQIAAQLHREVSLVRSVLRRSKGQASSMMNDNLCRWSRTELVWMDRAALRAMIRAHPDRVPADLKRRLIDGSRRGEA